MATPAGKAVVVTCFLATSALVSEEGPAHDRMPSGPSAILIEGMPSRSIGDALHPIGPTQHGNLFLQRHAAQQILNALVDRQIGILVGWNIGTAGVLSKAHDRREENRNQTRETPHGYTFSDGLEFTGKFIVHAKRPVLVLNLADRRTPT